MSCEKEVVCALGVGTGLLFLHKTRKAELLFHYGTLFHLPLGLYVLQQHNEPQYASLLGSAQLAM